MEMEILAGYCCRKWEEGIERGGGKGSESCDVCVNLWVQRERERGERERERESGCFYFVGC